MKVYLASGWFSKAASEEVTKLEEMLDRLGFDLASPRRIFVCPPDASEEVQQATFDGNLSHIRESDFILANSRDKDMGTIAEVGYAYAMEVPIVFFCQGLTGNFNLMLSRMGQKVTTSYEELESYLERVKVVGKVITEKYLGHIE